MHGTPNIVPLDTVNARKNPPRRSLRIRGFFSRRRSVTPGVILCTLTHRILCTRAGSSILSNCVHKWIQHVPTLGNKNGFLSKDESHKIEISAEAKRNFFSPVETEVAYAFAILPVRFHAPLVLRMHVQLPLGYFANP